MPLIYLAGGGTGGHLFPGLAIADALVRRNNAVSVAFIGSYEGMDKEIIEPSTYPLDMLSVGRGSPLQWRRPMNAPKFLLGLWQCWRLFRKKKPSAVIGLGGFAAAAPGIIAKYMGIPLFLMEPNAFPGRVNRLLAKWAKGIFLNFEVTRSFFESESAEKITTGSPVRSEFLFSIKQKGNEVTKDTIVVLGGSQGAKRLNDLFIEGAKQIVELGAKIVHVTGAMHYESVKEAYQTIGVEAEIMPFCTDVSALLRGTGLAVARSGSGTLSELAIMGIPAILVPLSTAMDDHQTANAKAYADAGGARIVDERVIDGDMLGKTVAELWTNVEERKRMSEVMLSLGKPMAAEDIAGYILAACVE